MSSGDLSGVSRRMIDLRSIKMGHQARHETLRHEARGSQTPIGEEKDINRQPRRGRSAGSSLGVFSDPINELDGPGLKSRGESQTHGFSRTSSEGFGSSKPTPVLLSQCLES